MKKCMNCQGIGTCMNCEGKSPVMGVNNPLGSIGPVYLHNLPAIPQELRARKSRKMTDAEFNAATLVCLDAFITAHSVGPTFMESFHFTGATMLR